jgi:hypothetical protein
MQALMGSVMLGSFPPKKPAKFMVISVIVKVLALNRLESALWMPAFMNFDRFPGSRAAGQSRP